MASVRIKDVVNSSSEEVPFSDALGDKLILAEACHPALLLEFTHAVFDYLISHRCDSHTLLLSFAPLISLTPLVSLAYLVPPSCVSIIYSLQPADQILPTMPSTELLEADRLGVHQNSISSRFHQSHHNTAWRTCLAA